MKLKKMFMYIGIIIIILIIICIGYIAYLNSKNTDEKEITEYIPQEEITDEQLRKTIVTLYFLDTETGKLMPEPRQIDVKELIDNPYYILVKLLIDGPKSENMSKIIPPTAILNEAKILGNSVYLDFSEGFVKEQNLGKEQEELIIKSIVNTLTELVEVNSVVITIDGKANLGFPDGGLLFEKPFIRELLTT